MRYTPDFSSRFRILKGGKISLVVSALLVGTTILSADQTISAPQITQVSVTTSENVIINSGVNITASATGTHYGVLVNSVALDHTITNSGMIQVADNVSNIYNAAVGIGLSGSSVTSHGAIINNGQIQVITHQGAHAYGIWMPYLHSGDGFSITNNVGGHIDVEAGTGVDTPAIGISMGGTYQNGSITNAGEIGVTSHINAIGIRLNTMDTGFSIVNSGTLGAYTNATVDYINQGENFIPAQAVGIHIGGMQGDSSITNSGTMTVGALANGSAYGIEALTMMNSSVITNSGTLNVYTAGNGSYAYAHGIDSMFMHDDALIHNTGLISVLSGSREATGIRVDGYYSVMNDHAAIVNSGTITVASMGAGTYGTAEGIFVKTMNTYAHITNDATGVITATADRAKGIAFQDMYGNSAITNSGTITANGGFLAHGIYGISINDFTEITNAAGGVVTATASNNAYGIYVEVAYGGTITNNGTISVNGGHASDGIMIPNSDSSNATIINSGTITAHVNGVMDHYGYAVNVEGGGHTVNNTATGKMYGNVFIKGALNNAGLISLPYNANGDVGNAAYATTFDQSATGTLEIGLMSDSDGVAHHSQLYANSAHFASGSTISVNVLTAAENQPLLIGQTLRDVVYTHPGQLTIDGPLQITDNSALLNFNYLVNGAGATAGDNTIDLVVVQAQTVADSTKLGGGGGVDTDAGDAIDRIKDLPGMAPFIGGLNNCETNECVAKAVASTTPQAHVSTQVAGTQIMNNVQGIVELRQNSTLGGMSSGDKGLSEQNLWVKPFVSTGNQDNKDGINGFGFKMRGLGIGYDAEYAPNQRAGVALFVTDADVNVNNMNQTSDVRVYNLLAYGNVPLDETNNFLYQAGYAWQKSEGRRYIGLTNETAHSDYTSQAATIDLKLMQTYKMDDALTLHPLAEATYRRFMTPSYDETGAGVLNLHMDDATSNHYLLGGGMIADYKLDKKSYLMVDLNLMYDFNHGIESVTAAYEGAAGVKFTSNGIDNGPWVYNAGIGYTMKTNENSELNFMYNYQGQGNSFDVHTLSAKYVWKF